MDIVELNLRTLEDLDDWPFERGPVYLIAWVDDDLLGACFVPPVPDARALLDHLASEFGDLWRQRAVAAAAGIPGEWKLDPPPAVDDPVSVVVCTVDRPRQLERCLGALRPQLGPGDELVVVENGPRETCREIAEGAGAVYALEPRPGSSWARNRGLEESRNPIVAFVDDDCVADVMWLQALREGFARDTRTAGVTGSVLASRPDLPIPALVDDRYPFTRGWYHHRFAGSTGTDLSPADSWRLGTGASMAWRREVLERLGGFDPALGAGTPPGGMEDLDLFRRALLEGAIVQYEPAALVFHDHPETLDDLRAMLLRYGVNRGAQTAKVLVEDRRARGATVRALLAEWRWLVRAAGQESVNLLVRRGRLPVTGLLGQPPAAVVGAVRFLRHRGALRRPRS